MLRVVLLFGLFAAPAFNVATASAPPRQPITVAAASHGIRISLAIPAATYPLDALAQFTVTVQNVSHANRYLQDFQPDWGGAYSPHILMRNGAGKLFYEEELSQFLAPSPGNLGGNYVLHPGETRTWRVRFVLEADNVRAITRTADGYTGFSARTGTPTPPPSAWVQHLWHIGSPWVHLSLTQEAAPTVTVRRMGSRLHISVYAPWPTTGPMYYMDSARCWTGKSTMSTEQDVPWTRARGHQFTARLAPHCPSRQPWAAVVGWTNHRVAFVSYRDTAAIR